MTEIEEVYQHWQQVMEKPRSRIDDIRKKAISGRLRDGYTVADLKDAIQGCAFSRFHRGENDRQKKYQDISLICRDAYHVDQFIEIFEAEMRKRQHVEKYRDMAQAPVRSNPEGMQQLKAILGGRK